MLLSLITIFSLHLLAQDGIIRPGQLWLDTDGNHINAHGGGVLFLKKKGYSNPHHDFYFMFHLSEQLVDGDLAQMQIDINKLESLLRSKGKMDNIFGRDPFPISMTELVNCQSAE